MPPATLAQCARTPPERAAAHTTCALARNDTTPGATARSFQAAEAANGIGDHMSHVIKLIIATTGVFLTAGPATGPATSPRHHAPTYHCARTIKAGAAVGTFIVPCPARSELITRRFPAR